MKKILLLNLCILCVCVFFNIPIKAQTNSARFTIEPISGYQFPTIVKPPLLTVGNGSNASTLIMMQSNVAIDETDMHIHLSANPQSEVHISIDKTNPNNILLSAMTFWNLGNALQGYYYTIDGGANWFGNDILPNNAYGRGDPSTGFSAMGDGYLVTLAPNSTASPDGYFVQKTTDKGVTWQAQIRGYGPVSGVDKEMIALDNMPGSPYANNFYCAWTEFTNEYCPSPVGYVKLNRSTNGGASFSSPIVLRNNNGLGHGVNVQTGPNGEVYVCWADFGITSTYPASSIGFTYSSNGGSSFSYTTNNAFSYTGINLACGSTNPSFNYIRVNDFPSMAVDKSCGANRGRIYIVYPEKEGGTGKAIIQVRYSDNQGGTWSTATTISISNATQSFFPWIAVDDVTGIVNVVYYAFDNSTQFSTNTYVAYSSDGGTTFNNIKVSDAPHITAPISGFAGGYAGDYIGIAAYDGKAYPSWMDNRNETWQIYVSKIIYPSNDIVLATGISSLSPANNPFNTNGSNIATVNKNLIILAGADITINNMKLQFDQGLKIKFLLSTCSSTGGKLTLNNTIIESTGDSWDGIIDMLSNSELILNSGSEIRLKGNGKILDNGKLTFNSGASILLQDANTILEIKGQLQIGNNASFNISGNGYIDFKNTGTTPNILAGTNSKFELTGTGKDDLKLKISSSAMLMPANNLTKFSISNSKVVVDNAMTIDCPYTLPNGVPKLHIQNKQL